MCYSWPGSRFWRVSDAAKSSRGHSQGSADRIGPEAGTRLTWARVLLSCRGRQWGAASGMPDSADNSAPQPGLSSEDQSTFQQWRLTFGAITGLGVTADERKAELERHQWRTCERWKRYLMNYSQSILLTLIPSQCRNNSACQFFNPRPRGCLHAETSQPHRGCCVRERRPLRALRLHPCRRLPS